MKKKILLLNGACGGATGNTARLFDIAETFFDSTVVVKRLTIALTDPVDVYLSALRDSDACIFGTGTYWDSWGSPLQRFFEQMTPTEGTDLWLGKPAGVVVSMHSVGGKGVLSRLQGVLNTFGMMIPPMSGFVYSVANQLAIHAEDSELAEDLWRPDDLQIICHNLQEALRGGTSWKSWPVDRSAYDQNWVRR